MKFQGFIGFGHPAKLFADVSAHGFDLFGFQLYAAFLAQVFEDGPSGDEKGVFVHGLDVFWPHRIVFILDVADDLLQDVLQGYKARCSPVFVENDGHVLLVGLKVQKDVFDVLGFGNEIGGPQDGSHIRRGLVVADEKAQKFLAVQNADDLILGFLVDR